MKRSFTILTAALALLACLVIPVGMWGQTRDTKTETFENQTAGTTYNSTQNYQAGNSVCGIEWTIYYGTVSTSGPIAGSKSAQMRWYKSASSNYPYLKSTTAIDGLTNVAFKAKVGNTAVKMDVHYSSDGNTWTALATAVTFSNTNATDFSYNIPSGGKYIKIGVSSSSTAPNSSYFSLLVDNVVFTYSPSVPQHTVTYHANVTGTTDVVETYDEGDDVTVAANTFTNPGYDFTEWNTEADGSGDSYNPEDVIEDIAADWDLWAQWEVSASPTGNIKFGSSDGHVQINATSVTGDDDLGNEWTITTAGTNYFSQNAVYSQVGSSNNPATSITFTTTLLDEVNVTDMKVKFGGFGGSAGTITMKVGNTTVGTGTIPDGSDVVVNSSSTATGDELTVTITGISKGIKCYYISYTYEATSSTAVATTTTISVPGGFNNDLHNGTNAGTLTASVTVGGSPISGATVTWSSSNPGVATVGESTGVVTLVAVGTTNITASYAGVEDVYRPSEDTYELTVINSNAPGTVNNPYTVAQAIANTPSSGNVYIQGVVSSFQNTSIVGDGSNYRYYISDDGTTTIQLLVYKGKGLNQATFTNANDLLVGDEVVIYGSLITYQNAPEVASGNYLYSWNRPTPPAQEYTLTIGDPANIAIHAGYGETGSQYYGTLNNGDSELILSGTEITLTLDITEGYNLDALTVVDGNNNAVTLSPVSGYENVWTFNMPNSNVTVNATAVVAPVVTTSTYTLATSIESGKQYIIVGQANSVYYAMGNDKGNNRYAYEISLDGTTATATVASGANVHEFTINSLATDGFYSICDAITPGYLYAASSSSNYLKTESTLDENHNGDWEISINSETGVASVVASNSSYTRNVMQFNNGSILFACYGSASQHPVYLYQKVEPTEYTLDIAGYGNNTSNGNWYLISSPLAGETNPENVTNLINNNTGQGYDLYYFDQTQELEWINYKPGQGSTNPGFSLVPGKGYLYANSGDANNTPNTVTLTFTGTPYSGNGQVTLKYTGNNNDMKGWNLVGNPFSVTTYVTEDYLVMNDEGTALIPSDREDNYVNRMEGIFVYTETDNKTMTFSKNPVGKSARLALNITKGRGVIDRAIVRFGTHQSLPKFQFRDGSTKVYIPMDGKDYAVVSAEGEGEKPVNFKAEENGHYTITVNPEEVEFNYLHLIDNMTGADIDLLQTPSYSFEARTTDYASRFRLVFSATGIEENNANEAFAYFNGAEWMVSNEGEASLEVIDLTGRILSSETINGNVAKAITAAPGIYMLRLVNDNEVKTQKILVK